MQNHNSNVNQDIKGKFVEREIIMNASTLVSDLQESELLSYDEFENMEYKACSDCGEEVEQKEEKYICYGCDKEYSEDEYDNLDYEYNEVYEYWFVTGYLFDKLKDYGQVVCDSPYGYIWGRQTTGQSILLDGIISRICAEMEILEGQKYDWSK